LVIKRQEKRRLGRERHSWEWTFKIGLKEMGWVGRDKWWGVVNMVMNLQVPWNARNYLTNWGIVSFSRMTVFHGNN
jgi:hypothetical protein